MLVLVALFALAQTPETPEAQPVVEPPPAVVAPVSASPPAPPAPPAPVPLDVAPAQLAAPSFGYQDGFFVQNDDGLFKLRIRGLIQLRATVEGSEPNVATWETAFAVQRTRLEFGGNAFSKNLTFLVRTEWGQGLTFAKDAYVNYSFIPEWIELRVGQWKRPFSRQELTSVWRQTFVDRSETNRFFKAGRDIGIALHNDVEKSRPIEYSVGLFAGGTDKPTIAPDSRGKFLQSNLDGKIAPTFVGRIGMNSGDVKGYNEADIDGGGVRFGLGFSALETIEPAELARGATRAEVDGILKFSGFDSSAAVFVSLKQEPDKQTFVQQYEALGVHAQVGYLVASFLHPGFRYDVIVSPLDDGSQRTRQELTAALGFLLIGQNVAATVDASALLDDTPDEGSPTTNIRARAQLSFAF